METKHTPGPWSITESSEHWGRINCTITSIDGDVATSWQQGTTLNRANAHLIAAAPELLALLIRYRKETPLGHQPHMIAHEVDAAIAKATGGEA